jgi:hypothetical protein
MINQQIDILGLGALAPPEKYRFLLIHDSGATEGQWMDPRSFEVAQNDILEKWASEASQGHNPLYAAIKNEAGRVVWYRGDLNAAGVRVSWKPPPNSMPGVELNPESGGGSSSSLAVPIILGACIGLLGVFLISASNS